MTRLIFVLLALCVPAALAQDRHLNGDQVQMQWEVTTKHPVGAGNGVYLSPQGDLLVVTNSDGHVQFLNPKSGAMDTRYNYPAESKAEYQAIKGGVIFAKPRNLTVHGKRVDSTYIAFCATSKEKSKLVLLYPVDFLNRLPEDKLLFESADLLGQCTGTPAGSADGQVIILTSNFGSTGSAYAISIDTEATTITHVNLSVPLSPVGCFWNPVESNFEQTIFEKGRNSHQDVFIWGYARSASNNRTLGQVWAFQFQNVVRFMGFVRIGDEHDFVSPHAPVIAQSGLSMFWAVSGNKQRAWIGQQGKASRDFSTDGVGTVSFPDKNSKAAATAPPVVSSDPLNPFVIGPTASNQLFRLTPLDYALQNNDSLVVPTVSPVTSRVVLSRDESRAYYATSEPNGTLNCVNSTTLELLWTLSIPDGVSGDMALSLDGETLYLANSLGTVRAYVVGDSTASVRYLWSLLAVPILLGLAFYAGHRTAPTKQGSPNDAPTPDSVSQRSVADDSHLVSTETAEQRDHVDAL